MKKKLLIAIFAITAALCCALGTACKNGNKNDNAGNDNTGNNEIVYTIETAYAAAKELGYGGTLEEFLESLKGKDGADGKDGLNGTDGKDGTNGKDGADGKDGTNGKDGVGVKDAYFNENGELIIVLTDGNILNCGKVDAPETTDQLQYVAIKENGEIVGYSVLGFSGNVIDTDVVIPSVYRDKPVVSIAQNAFYNCAVLTSVVIPDSVTLIGRYAFRDCLGLKSVTFGKGVKKFEATAFYGCRGLEKVNITDLASWCAIDFENGACYPVFFAKNLYLNGELLTELKIPDGVTSIGIAFSYCSALTSVIIPESVVKIEYDAFKECSGLEKIFYEGTSEGWEKIEGNYVVGGYKFFYSETEPSLNDDGTDYDGGYWHYDENGKPVVWDMPADTATTNKSA